MPGFITFMAFQGESLYLALSSAFSGEIPDGCREAVTLSLPVSGILRSHTLICEKQLWGQLFSRTGKSLGAICKAGHDHQSLYLFLNVTVQS